MLKLHPELSDSAGTRSCLVVLLHAYTHSAADMRSVAAVVRRAIPDAELAVPELPAGALSFADPNAVASDVAELIDSRWRRRRRGRLPPYRRIVLVGHSIGALLARKVYIIACGEDPRSPFEPPIRVRSGYAWAGRVERIVLLAGMNRGWRVSHHLGIALALQWSVYGALGRFLELVTRRKLLIFQMRRGGEFITQLRIQWLRLRHRAAAGARRRRGRALTVQLLGSIDDMVSPQDNVDLVSGRDFVYLDVPNSGHASVIDMDEAQRALPGDSRTIGAKRRQVLTLALTGSRAALDRAAVLPDDQAQQLPDLATRNVIFVIHGIRDAGHWTHKVARTIRKRAAADGLAFATETSSYGYFPMLPFLFAWKRREKVEWLMDQYAETLARYPNAEFDFVGHSNGTYCLARALELYPCCRFRRVVFAGSVVRRSYDWRRFLRDPSRTGPRRHGEVESVLNYVATADWVVAFFPKLFQFLHVPDLGSAGHDGFALATPDGPVIETRYVRGQHGAALQEANWDAIAEFVVTGRPAGEGAPAPLLRRDGREWWVVALGYVPAVVWLGLILIAILVGAGGFWVLHTLWPDLPSWAAAVALVGYLWTIWQVVTRL